MSYSRGPEGRLLPADPWQLSVRTMETSDYGNAAGTTSRPQLILGMPTFADVGEPQITRSAHRHPRYCLRLIRLRRLGCRSELYRRPFAPARSPTGQRNRPGTA